MKEMNCDSSVRNNILNILMQVNRANRAQVLRVEEKYLIGRLNKSQQENSAIVAIEF